MDGLLLGTYLTYDQLHTLKNIPTYYYKILVKLEFGVVYVYW